MASEKLLQELKTILEKQLKRTPTPEEVAEQARCMVEYFELARKINKTHPISSVSTMVYIKKCNNLKELKESYGKVCNTGTSLHKGTR